VRRVVCDTGPLLHLRETGALELLSLAGEVHIPIAVDEEMRFQAAGWSTDRPPWLRVTSLVPPHDYEADAWRQAGLLDAGEAAAIALARQLAVDWLLTDDAAARLLAQSLNLEVHGSLGVLLWAAAAGHLSRVEAGLFVKRLAGSSLWLSARVLAEAEAALDQLSS